MNLFFPFLINILFAWLVYNSSAPARDQFIAICFSFVAIPFLFNVIAIKNKNILSSKIVIRTISLVVPLLFLSIFLLEYNFELFYKYYRNATHVFNNYLLLFIVQVALLSIILYLNLRFLSKKIMKIALTALGVAFCIFMAYHVVIHEYHRYNENHLNLGIVFNSIIQVYHGASVMVDVTSQYGLYAHFIVPFLYIAELSITSISVAFSILFFFSIFSWFLFMLNTTRNYFLSLVGLIAAVFVSTTMGMEWPGEIYYQYMPLRSLFPAILLFSFIFYIKNQSLTSRIIISSILSLGIMWNIETGIAVFFAFIVFDLYLKYNPDEKFTKNLIPMLYTIIQSLTSCVVTVGLFFIFINSRSDGLTISSIFAPLFLYGGAFISGDHPWQLAARHICTLMLYQVGIAVAISDLFMKKRSNLSAGIFLVSILGIGVQIYYLFKSTHHSPAALTSYPLIILITLLASRIMYQNHNDAFSKILNTSYSVIAFLFLSYLSVLSLNTYRLDHNFYSTVRYHEIISKSPTNRKSLNIIRGKSDTSSDYITVADLANGNPENKWPEWVKKYNLLKKFESKDGNIRKDIFILSNYDYYLYLKLKAKSPINITNTNHIHHYEWDVVYDEIINNKSIEWIIFDDMSHANRIHVWRLNDMIKTNFNLVDEFVAGHTWTYSKWRENTVKIYKRIKGESSESLRKEGFQDIENESLGIGFGIKKREFLKSLDLLPGSSNAYITKPGRAKPLGCYLIKAGKEILFSNEFIVCNRKDEYEQTKLWFKDDEGLFMLEDIKGYSNDINSARKDFKKVLLSFENKYYKHLHIPTEMLNREPETTENYIFSSKENINSDGQYWIHLSLITKPGSQTRTISYLDHKSGNNLIRGLKKEKN